MQSPNAIHELQQLIRQFCEERDWNQFHTPKDLAIGISTEAAELLDIFRFKSESQIQELFALPDSRIKIENELADVFFFVLRFAQMNKIDLKAALESKMQMNAGKYPVATAKGSNKKYNEI